MDVLRFISTMKGAFNGQRVSESLASRAIGFFFTETTQTAYKNGLHPGNQDPTRLLVTWPLIVHSLLSRFITEDLLRNEYYSVNSARIKQIETEMKFPDRLSII